MLDFTNNNRESGIENQKSHRIAKLRSINTNTFQISGAVGMGHSMELTSTILAYAEIGAHRCILKNAHKANLQFTQP